MFFLTKNVIRFFNFVKKKVLFLHLSIPIKMVWNTIQIFVNPSVLYSIRFPLPRYSGNVFNVMFQMCGNYMKNLWDSMNGSVF